MPGVLTAIVVETELARAGTVPRSLADAMRSWFLGWVAERDEQLAAALHAGSHERPYTLSDVVWQTPLAPTAERVRCPLPSGAPATLRITSTDARLSALLIDHAATLSLDGHVINGVRLRTRRVVTARWLHPDAGCIEVAELLCSAERAETAAELDVAFVSSTTFQQRGRQVGTPTPDLAFGSWLRRWNGSRLGVAWPESLVFALAAETRLTRQRLHDAYTAHGSYGSRGSVGTCRYALPSDPALRRIAHVLAAFAFWCGTGKGGTMGHGQTRPESPLLPWNQRASRANPAGTA